jgi:ribonuclease Y
MNAMTWLMVLVPVVAVLAAVAGYLGGHFGARTVAARALADAQGRASRIVEDAKRLAEQARGDAETKTREAEVRARDAETKIRSVELEAKEFALKARAEADQEARARQRELQELERRVAQQEEQIGRRLDQLDRRDSEFQNRERALGDRERSLGEKEARLGSALEEQRRKLEAVAGLTSEEAKRQLMTQVEVESRREAQLLGMRLEEEARETAHMKAKEVLATTIQRLAPDYTVETAVSIVDLPSDDMKGRIIGREGRNIRALEGFTGVDLIVDDTPEAVLISAYDPYRREIARLALQRLIADGRIHPARIEEVVEKVKKEMEQHLREEGDKACFEVGVHGLHPELIKLVGRMKFRTSYGQNCLQHSKEVAWLAGMMAAEIGADVQLAKRMGLLHDIGKALTHEQEGSHPELSLQVLTKYNESPQVINAALCGHENVEAETIEAVLTEAADGISAARPGARRDVLESYIKRLAKLEEIAMSYKGVELCYAIQAGRELRIMTKADQISDLDAHQLAKDISKRIEAEMQYPGHIKVVVIRETRAVEVAK